MESEHFEDISNAFNQINIENEPGSEKNELYAPYRPMIYNNVPQQKLPQQPPEHQDFELYIKGNCHSKIKVLDRETFNLIKRPILIFFHHFRERCANLTKLLDRIYEVTLKFGDHFEFIAADMYDMDVIYPGTNPIHFFCRLTRPEHVAPNMYLIDEQKRIHEHLDCYSTVENLSELCEKYLSGKLFPSQPIPEDNETRLIKICVHHNYEELVMKSTKNIFLIVNLSQYQEQEPDYEKVALALRDYNLDIVYMEAEENYVPFEYCVNSYPTILFIPHNDKKNFIYYEDSRTEENVREFLKNCLEQPEFLQSLQLQQKTRNMCKQAKVSHDFSFDFNELPQFFLKHYDKGIMVLNRQTLANSKQCNLIAFMNFQGKCSAEHVEWFNKLYQVAETCYSFDFYVADFKDIDVINSTWNPEDLIRTAQGKPKIYAFDRLKNVYEFKHFDSTQSLYYFTDNLENGDLFYSQVYKRGMENELVKEWTANYFKIFLKKLKKHIFITFYSSDDENSGELFKLLDIMANEFKELNVEVVKFDVKFNYVSLEYARPSYPVHYFIPKNNKKDFRLYNDNSLSRDNMLEFIRNNVGELDC